MWNWKKCLQMGLRQPFWISCSSKETKGDILCPMGPRDMEVAERAGPGGSLWWRRKASATVALNPQPRTRENAARVSRSQHLHPYPPAHTSPQPHSWQTLKLFWTYIQLRRKKRAGNDRDNQKWLRLRVYYRPEGTVDIEIRFHYGKFRRCK